ncbi:MAG: sterol desaturase family protein [Candidatus Obscuribacterales bacterium]|nr:sterol desaturase family protein [Candidatus Obscuribacterales bacterium]
MYRLIEIPLCLMLWYVFYSFLEYTEHRWLLHKMRVANSLQSEWLRQMCRNHMKLHHGRDYEHDEHHQDDNPLQLAIVGFFPSLLAAFFVHKLDAFAAKLLISYGAAYAVLFYVVHLEMHLRRGWFFSKTWLFRKLDERHRDHHVQPNSNYNVVLPLFDWIFRTTASKHRVLPRIVKAVNESKNG